MLAVLKGIGLFLGGISPKVWGIIAGVIALLGVILWIRHDYHKALNEQYQKGRSDEAAHVLKEALALKNKTDTLTGKITTALQEKNHAEATRIVTVERDVLVRGPGKASCSSGPGFTTPANRPVAPVGSGDAAVAQVPDSGGQRFIALPFDDAVRFAGQCDLNRNDRETIMKWWPELQKVWPKQGNQ